MVKWTDEVNRGWIRHHKDWDKKLFAKPYAVVIKFLLERFETTSDTSEYYCCIPYLIGTLSYDVLGEAFENREVESPKDSKILVLPSLGGIQSCVCEHLVGMEEMV